MARTFVNLGSKVWMKVVFVLCPRCVRWVRPLRHAQEVPAGHVRTGTRNICKAMST